MAHVVKCTICGERFDRDNEPYVKTSSSRYAHAHCALDKWDGKSEKPRIIDPNNFRVCTYCKKYINLTEDEYVKVTDNLYAHKECFDKEQERPKSDREKLEIYICKLFDLDFCTPAIIKQLNSYENDRGYTASGMLKTLVYFYDVKANPVPDRPTVGILPYIYDEAKNYYKKLYYSNLYNKNRDMHNYIPQTEKVTIPVPHREVIKKRNLFTFLDEEGEENKQ